MSGTAIRENTLSQILLAEGIGTFILVFIDAGGAVISGLVGGADVPPMARALAAGLTVMALIFSFGHISGAHLNPAVSLAFYLRGVFPGRRLLLYWLMQILGACGAALLLRGLFGDALAQALARGNFAAAQVFAMEVVLTCILVLVILSTAQRIKVTGPNAALPVGACLTFCSLVGRPVSDAIMNPARALAPAIVMLSFYRTALFVVAALLGAVLAVWLTSLIHGRETAAEREAAQGQKAPSAD